MGVFNTVIFTCPKCDDNVEVQSKAEDGCHEWDQDDVPLLTANHIAGREVWCKKCSQLYTVVVRVVKTVPMGLM
jgi:hypothetical protein